jgi:hypothetical protein
MVNMFTHDEYSPEGYAEREEVARYADIEFGIGWEVLAGERFLDESLVAGGFDSSAELAAMYDADSLYELRTEALFDPDYPLG